MRFSTFFTLFISFTSSWAYEFSPKSAAQVSKEAQRWSLAQWMEQKGKIQWMDLWLNSNRQSPSFYEVYFGADHTFYDRSRVINGGPATDTSLTATGFHAGMFISLFGIHGRYERCDDDDRTIWDGVAQLRLLGANDQGTNLTVFYGYRSEKYFDDDVVMPQTGGSLTLYLINRWAIQGRYQKFMEKTSNPGNTYEGERIEATTWIEWGPSRFFGTYFREPMEITNIGGTERATREGFNVGLRFYLDFKK